MRGHTRGFTLVEILIVVIILGILAAIVIPQFTNATSDPKTNSLKSSLHSLRGQIELFKRQHNDIPPSPANLVTVLTGKTTVGDATTAASNAVGTYGPYMTTFPVNPLNGFNAVAAAGGTTVGWVYATGVINPVPTVTQYTYAIWATDAAGATTGVTSQY